MAQCACFGGKKSRQKLNVEKEKDLKPSEASDAGDDMSSVQVNAKSESALEEISVSKDDSYDVETPVFSYRELAKATNNFRNESLLGEGGFGPVYKGNFESTGQMVAVKMLNHSGVQGEKEFLVEVLMLSLARHPNLVNLVGFCAEGKQRLLVYEFMPLGSLERHLHDLKPDKQPLDWNTRMMIAAGAAKGLNYLHNEAVPPVIYRDLKSSNILLDEGFNPKLSDFGLAKFGPSADKSHVSTRVMGTHGYCAPEYAGTGKLTVKSDIYSFGIVLLELITGRKALDTTRVYGKQPLIDWVRPLLRDRRNILQLADPKLRGLFPRASLRKAIELALMCLRDDAQSRPDMSEIVVALNYLASEKYDPTKATANFHGHGKERIIAEGGKKKNRSMMEDLGTGTSSEETSPVSRERERERAVAEAKMWGETWREKRRQSTKSEFDKEKW